MDSAEVLKEIAGQVTVCQKCNLHFSRKKAVPGEGPSSVELMFIGEGPGFYENEQGRPFVGPSGKFLDELLARAGVSREKVFITNVVKCRPPGNNDPQPEELAACRGYLERQIEALNPKVIVTLGRFSMAHFLPNAKISSAHGKATWVNGRLVVAMYHPAAALRQPSLQETVLEDFSHLPEFIRLAQKTQAGHVIPASASINPAESATQSTPAKPRIEQHSLLDGISDQAVEPPAPQEENPDDSGPVQLSLF